MSTLPPRRLAGKTLAAALLLGAAALPAHADQIYTGNQLYSHCTSNVFAERCIGYVTGVMDVMLAVADRPIIWPPGCSTNVEIANLVVRHFAYNTGRLGMPAATLVMETIGMAPECGTQAAVPQRPQPRTPQRRDPGV